MPTCMQRLRYASALLEFLPLLSTASTGLDLPNPLFLPQIPNNVHTEPLLSLELQWKHFLPLAEHLRRTRLLNHRKKKPFMLGPEIPFLVSVPKGHFREP